MKLIAPQKSLRRYSAPNRAEIVARFFKTGPGEYGEGDQFLGVTVPQSRSVAKEFWNLSLKDTKLLLKSPWHEDRLVGLMILVEKYRAAQSDKERANFVKFYLAHRSAVNNWDLVDSSACQILGDWALRKKSKSHLLKFATSKIHWERRIAMVGTLAWIRAGQLSIVYEMAPKFFSDDQDLMHKATGWMLREAGKKNPDRLRRFLWKHLRKLPRTSLRYAIERFPYEERQRFIKS